MRRKVKMINWIQHTLIAITTVISGVMLLGVHHQPQADLTSHSVVIAPSPTQVPNPTIQPTPVVHPLYSNNPQIEAFIEKARQSGYSDSQIKGYLNSISSKPTPNESDQSNGNSVSPDPYQYNDQTPQYYQYPTPQPMPTFIPTPTPREEFGSGTIQLRPDYIGGYRGTDDKGNSVQLHPDQMGGLRGYDDKSNLIKLHPDQLGGLRGSNDRGDTIQLHPDYMGGYRGNGY